MPDSSPTSVSMPSDSCPKAIVSVSTMARMVGLSRSRFYSLVDQEVFPRPVYLLRTKRPVYTAELQDVCLDVRRRGIGFSNGEPVLFYDRHLSPPKILRAKKKTSKKNVPSTDEATKRLIDGLRQLGMTDPKHSKVVAAVTDSFPDGTDDVDPGAVLAAVYRRLKQRDSGENHGR